MRALLATLLLFVGARAAAADDDPLCLAIDSYLDERLPVLAAEPEPDPRNVGITLYAWIASLEGTVGARRVTAPVDASFDDILDDLEFALMLRATVHDDEWHYVADIFYLDVESTVVPRIGPSVTTRASWFIFELTAGRDVAKTAIGDSGELTAQAYGGLRIHSIDNRISIGGTSVASETRWLFDPIIGGEVRITLSGVAFVLRGDIGGFGVGSDFTWNVIVGVDVRISGGFAIEVGYRWLDIDGETEGLVLDVRVEGPFFAITFRF